MMFEIEVSKSQDSLYEDSFSVSQVSTDPTFIEKHSHETPSTQESVSQPKLKMVDFGVEENVDSIADKGETSVKRDVIIDVEG
ncbi:unnamed protein product [Cuscuta campestris]|uniref:Uncharacterized protein n=1 Tax=Cuscuta campestris TaxID=132261 RepID=A0A484M213_9ASTE|nr:unnamed protein product [Cuscuta campestris]